MAALVKWLTVPVSVDALVARFRAREAKIGVIGLGYVGCHWFGRSPTRALRRLALISTRPRSRDAERRRINVAVICTDHDGIDYQLIVDQCPLIIDTRNAFAVRGIVGGRVIKE